MNLSIVYQDLKTRLAAAGIATAELEARRILEVQVACGWADIIAGEVEIDVSQCVAIESTIQRRIEGEPLSRIFGTKEFWGMSFEVSPETLDPRPETELIVERALEIFKDNPPTKILDLGTGTGCILAALLHEFTTATGVGVDVSSGALQVAQSNLKAHDLERRAVLKKGEWFQPIAGEYFNLIVSNPPYIETDEISNLDESVKNYDPILALDGGKNGLQAYKTIFSSLRNHLNPGGIGLFEIGYNQHEDVVRLSKESGLTVLRVHHDLARWPRLVEITCGDK